MSEQDCFGFIGANKAARMLGISGGTLKIWRCHGRGPCFIKNGGLIQYRLADVETYIKDHTFQSTREAKQATARS